MMMQRSDANLDSMIRIEGIMKKMEAGALPISVIDGHAVFVDGRTMKL